NGAGCGGKSALLTDVAVDSREKGN
ncbi:unnamed protein product, partial [Didymodactylos carnosus]